MKILAISDQIEEHIHSPLIRERYRDVDLVIGCGDLPYAYLEYIVSLLNVPLFYVPGNHDPQCNPASPASRAEGCICLDQQVAGFRGLLLAGLGGCSLYQPGSANQYTQAGMYGRLSKILPPLLWQRLRRGHAPDIMVTHAPPRGIHDDNDPAHIGFRAFRDIIRWLRPRYFLHGHTMFYKNNLLSPVTQVGGTAVINVYPCRLIEIETA